MGFEEKILDTLTDIKKSLERIEQSLNSETQHETIKKAVLRTLTGENTDNYMKKAIDSAIHGTFQ